MEEYTENPAHRKMYKHALGVLQDALVVKFGSLRAYEREAKAGNTLTDYGRSNLVRCFSGSQDMGVATFIGLCNECGIMPIPLRPCPPSAGNMSLVDYLGIDGHGVRDAVMTLVLKG